MISGTHGQRVALLDRLGHSFADRPSRGSIRILPIQTVLFSGSADQLLRVLVNSGIVVNRRGILQLRLDVSTAHLKGVQFVGADPPEENLLPAGLGIEIPFARFVDDGNRQGPIVFANLENGAGW